MKNIFLKKIDKQDIEESLKKYDIILPQKTKIIKPFMEIIKDLLRKNPDYGPSIEDYEILKKYLKENQKKYYPEYTNIMNGKEIYILQMISKIHLNKNITCSNVIPNKIHKNFVEFY